MGAGGVPNRTVIIVRIDKHGALPTRNVKPNSRYDLYVHGEKKQSRWFDSTGKVIRNRDYFHQDAHNDHFFPHDHIWNWTTGFPKRDKNILPPDYKNYK